MHATADIQRLALSCRLRSESLHPSLPLIIPGDPARPPRRRLADTKIHQVQPWKIVGLGGSLVERAASSAKDRVVSIIVAVILAVLALGIANWGIEIFGISGDTARVAVLIAVGIIIGPTIAAFAMKKHF